MKPDKQRYRGRFAGIDSRGRIYRSDPLIPRFCVHGDCENQATYFCSCERCSEGEGSVLVCDVHVDRVDFVQLSSISIEQLKYRFRKNQYR